MDLVSEGSRREEPNQLQYSMPASITRKYDTDLNFIFNVSNGPKCQQMLLPGISQIYTVNTITVLLVVKVVIN